MRKIVCILILLSWFGLKQIHPKAEQVFALQQLSGLTQNKNTLSERFPGVNFNVERSRAAVKTGFSNKKSKPRAIETERYSPPDEDPFCVHVISKKLLFPSLSFCSFHFFFSNEKRGPPAILVS